MTDRVLFVLDEEGGWALGFDANQWMILRAKKFKSGNVKWQAMHFIGSHKRVLRRILRERGITPTPEANARLNSFPDRFLEWYAQHEAKEVA